MLLALAYLEEDDFALPLALFAALCSLAVSGATVWGSARAHRFFLSQSRPLRLL